MELWCVWIINCLFASSLFSFSNLCFIMLGGRSCVCDILFFFLPGSVVRDMFCSTRFVRQIDMFLIVSEVRMTRCSRNFYQMIVAFSIGGISENVSWLCCVVCNLIFVSRGFDFMGTTLYILLQSLNLR